MNTARSLDLLRHNLQRYINQEINQVIQKYIEVSSYFIVCLPIMTFKLY